MVTHHDTESVIWRIDKHLKSNPSSIGELDIYLGARGQVLCCQDLSIQDLG